MAVSDVEAAANLLKLAFRSYTNLHDDHLVALVDAMNIMDKLQYLAESLRQDYDILQKDPDEEIQERFFLNVDGEIQECTKEEYDARQTETGSDKGL